MGKKKDARKAAKVADSERQKTVESLVGEVAALKKRLQTTEERLHVLAAHSNDRGVPA